MSKTNAYSWKKITTTAGTTVLADRSCDFIGINSVQGTFTGTVELYNVGTAGTVAAKAIQTFTNPIFAGAANVDYSIHCNDGLLVANRGTVDLIIKWR